MEWLKFEKKTPSWRGSDRRYDRHENENTRGVDDATVQPFNVTHRKKSCFARNLLSWTMRRRRIVYWNTMRQQWLYRRLEK